MYILKLTRYESRSGESVAMEVQIPARVTITGKENHFRRAVEDVEMVLAGLREMDRALGNFTYKNSHGEDVEVIIRYDVTSLECVR